MKLSIIGTGHMGSALAARFAQAGHRVFIGSRDATKAQSFARTLGGTAQGGTIAEAGQHGEVVILAVPYAAAATLAALALPAGCILLDLTNPLTPDYQALTIGHTTSAGEENARLLAQRVRGVAGPHQRQYLFY